MSIGSDGLACVISAVAQGIPIPLVAPEAMACDKLRIDGIRFSENRDYRRIRL
jgi:hypothetical protein